MPLPCLDNEKVREACELSSDIYQYSCVGGGLHIVIDDCNMSDGAIKECLGDFIPNKYREEDDYNCGHEVYCEKALAEHLLTMTIYERLSYYSSKHRTDTMGDGECGMIWDGTIECYRDELVAEGVIPEDWQPESDGPDDEEMAILASLEAEADANSLAGRQERQRTCGQCGQFMMECNCEDCFEYRSDNA